MSEIIKLERKKELKKETVDSYIDKLSAMYQMAYESYNALQDRNAKLLKACRMLEAGDLADIRLEIVERKLAHAEEIAKQIVEGVHHEAIAIARQARDEVDSIYDTMDRMLDDVRYGLKESA